MFTTSGIHKGKGAYATQWTQCMHMKNVENRNACKDRIDCVHCVSCECIAYLGFLIASQAVPQFRCMCYAP